MSRIGLIGARITGGLMALPNVTRPLPSAGNSVLYECGARPAARSSVDAWKHKRVVAIAFGRGPGANSPQGR